MEEAAFNKLMENCCKAQKQGSIKSTPPCYHASDVSASVDKDAVCATTDWSLTGNRD